jgi:hypothetical protein
MKLLGSQSGLAKRTFTLEYCMATLEHGEFFPGGLIVHLLKLLFDAVDARLENREIGKNEFSFERRDVPHVVDGSVRMRDAVVGKPRPGVVRFTSEKLVVNCVVPFLLSSVRRHRQIRWQRASAERIAEHLSGRSSGLTIA